MGAEPGLIAQALLSQIEKITSLSMDEIVLMKATFLALDNKEFQCAECLSKYKGREDFKVMTERSRTAKACTKMSDTAIHNIDREIFFKKCVGNYFTFPVLHWIRAHNHFEKGILPFPGSLMDQPNKAMEVFEVVAAWKQSKLEKLHRENEAKRKIMRAKHGRKNPS